MSFGIIDVLMHHSSPHSASFVANSAAAPGYVELTIPAPISEGSLATLDGRDLFTYGDNFIILSAGCMLPLGFEFWNDTDYWNQGYNLWVLNRALNVRHELPNQPFLWCPYANYEMSLGQYFPGFGLIDPPIVTDFKLTAKFLTEGAGFNTKISMYNAPVALDGKTFYAPIFVKVLHSYPLYAEPS